MSKLSDALKLIGIHNNHNLLARFGVERDVWVDYYPESGRAGSRCSMVYSVTHKTDPKSPWYSYGNKAFYGKKANTFPLAQKWAEDTYGITEWAVSPFGGIVPAHVLAAAKAAVKGKQP